MDHREMIIRENFAHLQQARAGMSGMTEAQLSAVNKSIKAIDETLDFSTELLDLRLSDLASLRDALYKLQHNFSAEPSEHHIEGFAEFGLNLEEEI